MMHLPYARLRVMGKLDRCEVVVVVDGKEVAQLPATSHGIHSNAHDRAAKLMVETFCYDYEAEAGIPNA